MSDADVDLNPAGRQNGKMRHSFDDVGAHYGFTTDVMEWSPDLQAWTVTDYAYDADWQANIVHNSYCIKEPVMDDQGMATGEHRQRDHYVAAVVVDGVEHCTHMALPRDYKPEDADRWQLMLERQLTWLIRDQHSQNSE